MAISIRIAALIAIVIVLFPIVEPARRMARPHQHHSHHHAKRIQMGDGTIAQARMREADTVQIAGSSLPNCLHACGSCSPCKLVMVSFVCASLEEAETCPMAYKCMCKSRSYPVP